MMSSTFILRCMLPALCVLLAAGDARAQAMPDPKQMSGIPRPDSAVPAGSVTVRLIRGDLANRILNHPVELFVNDKPQQAKTDGEGRAQFDKLPVGATLKAVATVDGERLESQAFEVPASGPGIRLMLVATDKEKEARKAAEAAAPAVSGQVILGGDTRVIVEPGDEALEVFYILEIMNNARAPVNPSTPFDFEMPTGVTGTTLFEGSTPLAKVTGNHVRVNGPFPPGTTSLQLGARLPFNSGSVDLAVKLPATVERLMVLVKKLGDTRLASPQIQNQQDFPSGNEVVIAGVGGAVPANQPIVLQLTGLPHHSQIPRLVALGLAGFVVVAGFVAGRRPNPAPDGRDERKKLLARREKLLHELVRLEQEHRSGRGDRVRYAPRREELVTALERVYGALDTGDAPGPGDRTGLAA